MIRKTAREERNNGEKKNKNGNIRLTRKMTKKEEHEDEEEKE